MFQRICITLVLVTSMFTLNACSPVGLLNFTVPKGGYTVYKDLAYGDDPHQKLDIYVPKGLTRPAPVVVFYYGGSWQWGSKDDYVFAGQAFASKGYVTVIADYRVYPQVYFPTFLNDSAKAFVWTHAHIAQYQGDTQNLFLAGHSAGAYNAVMLTVNDAYLKNAGGSTAWIKGTIGLSGPYDFLPFTDPKIIALFSKVPDETTQPINYVDKIYPPMFLATGNDDSTVYPKNTLNITAKLRRFNSPVEMHIYPGLAHIGMALSLARGFRYKAPTLEDVAHFIDAHSGHVPVEE